jgi:hypothetical protein
LRNLRMLVSSFIVASGTYKKGDRSPPLAQRAQICPTPH